MSTSPPAAPKLTAPGSADEPAPPAVQLTDITKTFPGVVACAGANLTVQPGSVHALLGQNGAGKTSLVNVLAGNYVPDSGEVQVAGVTCHFRSPAHALAAGVGMVHQEFHLVESLTVAENVVLGAVGQWLRPRAIAERVASLAERYGLAADPSAPVWQLSVGERQRVEILKALWRDAAILVLDEPTAVLTPAEAEALAVTLTAMRDEGRAVIYISHKLDEVLAVCTAATVLRGGKTVAEFDDLANVSRSELIEHMLGTDAPTGAAGVALVATVGEAAASELAAEAAETSAPPAGQPAASEGDHAADGPASKTRPRAVLEVRDLSVVGAAGNVAVDGVTLSVGAGEIVGIAGVAGNGQHELADAIAGLRPAISGTVLLAGSDVTDADAAQLASAGLAYVPEDRLGVGLAPSMPITDNAVLRAYRQLGARGLLSTSSCLDFTGKLVQQFNVNASQLGATTANLSGGNLQKLLLGRELSTQPVALVAAQPTRGLDVAAIESVTELLRAQRDAGVAVLVISEDVDELLALTDHLVVMLNGKVTAEFNPKLTTRLAVGAAMATATAGSTT